MRVAVEGKLLGNDLVVFSACTRGGRLMEMDVRTSQ